MTQDTASPVFACLDKVSPVLFVAVLLGVLIAGWILKRHNNLTVKETYLALTLRHSAEKPRAYNLAIAATVAGTVGYFVYAYHTVCVV